MTEETMTEETKGIGDWFECSKKGFSHNYWLLAQVCEGEVALIGHKVGNRLSNPIKAVFLANIRDKEWEAILSDSFTKPDEWKKVEIELIKRERR